MAEATKKDTQEEIDAFVAKHGPRSYDHKTQSYKSIAETIADRRRGHNTDAPPIFVDDTSKPNRHTETGYSRKLNPFYSDALSEQMQHRLADKPLSLRQTYAALDGTLTRSNPEFEDQGSAGIPQRTPEQNAAFDQITQHRARERAIDQYGRRPSHAPASLPFYMQYDPNAQEYVDTRPDAPTVGSQRRGLPTPATSYAGQAPTVMPTAMPTASGSYADRAQASMPTSSGSYSSGSYSSVPESMTPSWMRGGSAPAPAPAPAPASTGHNGLLPALDREHSSVPEHLMPSWLRGRSSGESDMIPPEWRGGTGG